MENPVGFELRLATHQRQVQGPQPVHDLQDAIDEFLPLAVR